ncbi:MAG: zf-HC2 domain-containing protein [bacterium]|jgi:anti-sigma factor RsiW
MSGGMGNSTTQCAPVREALSDYVEGSLPSPRQQLIERHIKECSDCAHEERQMRMLMHLLHHQVPRREPALDIWAEMAPKIAAIDQEEKLAFGGRLKLKAGRFLGSVAAGAIVFTQVLAANTEARMSKYVKNDPFTANEGSRVA